MKLDGWTKVGDKVTPTGKWTVYRFKGKEFDEVMVLQDFPPEDLAAEVSATAAYAKVVKDGVKRGAVWLVAPDGTVKDLVFVRPYG